MKATMALTVNHSDGTGRVRVELHKYDKGYRWVLAGTYADAGLPTRATKRESIRDAKAAWGDKIWGLRFVKL